ncbi:MAG TPA: hypothetical protein VM734_30360 [Kofleriaceae bacterium]|nr:hypothetical protein [Kofleriaceae bacterium]
MTARALAPVVALAIATACGSPPGAGPDDAAPADDAATADGAVDAAPPIDAPPTDAAPLGDPFAELVALPGTCTTDGWCWRTPTPHGNDYVRVVSSAPDNIWLTARQGTVMQWDGHTWRFHRPPVLPGQQVAQFPMSMSTGGPSNTWMIYGNTLQHWDGATWTIRSSQPNSGNPNYNNVWVAPDGDAWVTVSNGTLERWHGATSEILSPCAGCFLGSIWGTSSTDIFITTLPAGILHFDGTTWNRIYGGPEIAGGYLGVPGDVWVSGGEGALMRWDGATWTAYTPPLSIPRRWITPVAYRAPDDVWWWVFGEGFLHWNGTSLTLSAVDFYQDGGLPSFNSAAIIGGRWWLVGDAGAVYSKSDHDVPIAIVKPQLRGLLSMWGTADDNMYLSAGGRVRHWDGTAMTDLGGPLVTRISGVRTGGVDELFGTGEERTPDNLWITTAWRFDGTTWTRTAIETAPLFERRLFNSVAALGPGQAIAVGFKGIAYHYSNGTWSPIATGVTTDLYSVWGPDPDHAWIAGRNGVLLRWDRTTPDVAMPEPGLTTTADLGPVHGADGVLWVAEAQTSSVWRNNGAGWTKIQAVTVGNGETGGMFAVDADNIVMASSGQTSVGRWNGTSFAREDTGSGLATPILFQPPGGRMLAGWMSGLVEHE